MKTNKTTNIDLPMRSLILRDQRSDEKRINDAFLDQKSTHNKDFKKTFSVLYDVLNKVEVLTKYDSIKEQMKFADNAQLGQGMRNFLKIDMSKVLELVD